MSVLNYEELKKHVGHKLVCVGYALRDEQTGKRLSDFHNVAIECEDCNEVLLDFNNDTKKYKEITRKKFNKTYMDKLSEGDEVRYKKKMLKNI